MPYPEITIRETEDPMLEIVQDSPDAFSIMSPEGVCVLPQTPLQEEALISEQNPRISSGLFGVARSEFRPHFRAMIAKVFDKFSIGKRDGVDIGSGASGEMLHELLPLTEEERNTWTECELNQGAIEMHRSIHPQSRIRKASYLHLSKSLGLNAPVDTVSGLSSLDATNHLDRAISEIRDALSTGGYLVHVQDVRPGLHNGLNEMEHNGMNGHYEFIVGNMGPQVPPNEVPNPFGYIINGVNSGTNYVVSAVELLRHSLERAVSRVPGIELVYSNWLEATSEQPQGDKFSQYFECMVSQNPNAKEKKAYAVVTVAQKT